MDNALSHWTRLVEQHLSELFHQPSQASWDWREDYDANAKLLQYEIEISNGRHYLLSVKFLTMGMWSVVFMLRSGNGGSTGINHTGNAAEVLNAVIDCLRHFIRERQPKALTFTAKEASRQKLYHVIARKLATEIGWQVKTQDEVENGVPHVRYIISHSGLDN